MNILGSLGRLGASLSAPPVPLYAPPVEQLAPGSVVGGDFRVVSSLGAGGMGAIYVAEQLSTGKHRALKLMHPSLVQDAALRDRFAQEARVGSMIASDHVVQVVGAGVDPSGAPWIAMELLDGESLTSCVATRGALPLGEVGELLRSLCHALGAAHAAGVVHRDIKPDNLFLARTQSTSAPISLKVLDFGIAKVVQQAHATATAMMGTPLWMAPEQSEALGRVGPPTDVWAVGLVAFWMLAGRAYWMAAQANAPSVHALLREVLFEPLEPASVRAQRLGAPPLPPAFDAWFAGCVAREPERRFPDASAAFAAFARDVLGAPFQSDPRIASAPFTSPAPASAAVTQPQVTSVTSLAPPAPPKRSLGLLVGIGGLVIGLGAVCVAAVVITLVVVRAPEDATPVSPPPPVVPVTPAPSTSTTGSASSAPISPRPPSSATAKPVVPLPSAPASASAAPKKPFDEGVAKSVVTTQASFASKSCKSLAGPAAVSGVVTYNNSGKASAIPASNGIPTARHSCVGSVMSGGAIPAFDGPSKPIFFSVAF